MSRRVGVAVLLALCLVGAGPLDTGAARRHRHRSGCGTFCRQAGGLGGNPGVAPCKVLNRVIRVKAGIAPVTVRCFGRHTSRGAVAIFPHDFILDYVNDGVPNGSYDGVDLVVPANHTVTFHIPLSHKALALLQRKHSLRVDVLVELNTRPVHAVQRNGVRLALLGG